ncbi:regulatory protein RecX [Motiliproteus sp.]|uniref:regulatory protein RecX n=1 Tax=Motiliproteus sp. TaxID=1898955 RepID=UPI003BAB8C18
MSDDEQQQLMQQLRQSAYGLLSRREYSRLELRRKLAGADVDSTLLEQLLDQLQQQGLQSDQRFCESFIRSRIGRGQGEVRIVQELRQRGIDEELTRGQLEACEQDWFELARGVRQRRFGEQPPQDQKQWAKQLRFLLYRGFSQEQARYAIESGAE